MVPQQISTAILASGIGVLRLFARILPNFRPDRNPERFRGSAKRVSRGTKGGYLTPVAVSIFCPERLTRPGFGDCKGEPLRVGIFRGRAACRIGAGACVGLSLPAEEVADIAGEGVAVDLADSRNLPARVAKPHHLANEVGAFVEFEEFGSGFAPLGASEHDALGAFAGQSLLRPLADQVAFNLAGKAEGEGQDFRLNVAA